MVIYASLTSKLGVDLALVPYGNLIQVFLRCLQGHVELALLHLGDAAALQLLILVMTP
jgi:hypothetical protein